jgi:hypothetical protein
MPLWPDLGIRLPSRSISYPRMADFAIWVSACERALGLTRGEALEAYQANCAEARNLALEASPLYEPLREVARAGFSDRALAVDLPGVANAGLT